MTRKMMREHKELLVIIPAHNEEENIQKVLKKLKSHKIRDIADILVIDDASDDSTGEIVKSEYYMCIRNIRRLGYGNSLRLGYQYAVSGEYSYVIQMDADGQHDVCNIPVIYQRLKEQDEAGEYPDIVLASRFMEGSPKFRVGIFKRFAYAWFRSIIWMVTGRRIADPTTGLQGLNRRAFSFYSDYRNFDNKYPDANIVIQMLLLKFHVAEIPAVMHAREDGESMHRGFSAFWYMCRMFFEIPAVILRVKFLNRKQKKTAFQKADLRESSRPLNNPGCGWYHLYPFTIPLSGKISLEETKACLGAVGEREQLVLAVINIYAFRSREITNEALEAAEHIFQLFHENGKQMIVRFTYDSEGQGMEHEPGGLSVIKRHMEQLGDVIQRYSSDILTLQGIFVGSWGEMHHSKFVTAGHISELILCLDNAVKGSCFLSVRTPAQWRSIMENREIKERLESRLGLFNDGIFGSATDLGTYAADKRQEELGWQERFVPQTPNGGETVAGDRIIGYLEASKEMEKMHLTYLNGMYHPDQLNHWKEECVEEPGCFKGLNGYEYIGRHLGYRFFVRDVMISKAAVEIIIENCGFAGLFEDADCFLITEDADGNLKSRPIEADARKWKRGEKSLIYIPCSGQRTWEPGSRIYLQLKRKRDGRVLEFANQGAEDKVLLGIFGRMDRKEKRAWIHGIG